VDSQVQISDTALADFEDILEYSWRNFPAFAFEELSLHRESRCRSPRRPAACPYPHPDLPVLDHRL